MFFGILKDIVGRAGQELEINEGATLETILTSYMEQFPALKQHERSLMLARNQEFASRQEAVADGDEIAFLPPVSGGSGAFVHEIADESGHFFALTREPIDTGDLEARLLNESDGAVVVFKGVVRNNSGGRMTKYLDYESYEPMAIKVIADIGRGIAASHEIGRIAIVHRLGRLQIGETSVVVAVTAPHREPAFQAALEGINQIKHMAPIWKKEHYHDGDLWVEGEWDASVRNI